MPHDGFLWRWSILGGYCCIIQYLPVAAAALYTRCAPSYRARIIKVANLSQQARHELIVELVNAKGFVSIARRVLAMTNYKVVSKSFGRAAKRTRR